MAIYKVKGKKGESWGIDFNKRGLIWKKKLENQVLVL